LRAYHPVAPGEVPTTARDLTAGERSCPSAVPSQGLELKLPTEASSQQGTAECGRISLPDRSAGSSVINACDDLLGESKSRSAHTARNGSTFLSPTNS